MKIFTVTVLPHDENQISSVEPLLTAFHSVEAAKEAAQADWDAQCANDEVERDILHWDQMVPDRAKYVGKVYDGGDLLVIYLVAEVKLL